MTEGQASISSEILARYAADAAREVPGVQAIAGRRGVKVEEGRIELRLVVDWGVSIPAVGRDVQERVRAYLGRMADLAPVVVDVIVESVA